MRKRQAKKNVKRKWKIETYNYPYSPRYIDKLFSYVSSELSRKISEKFDEAILYGESVRGEA